MKEILASPFAAQPGALLAGLLMAFLLMRLGRGAFPARLFGASMCVGAVMATLVVLLEAPFGLRGNLPHFSAVTTAFGFAGFPEEAAKLAGTYLFLRPHYLRRTSRDLALAMASAALGFALLENMLYIAAAGQHWGPLAFARALTAVPCHVFLGLIGGGAIARADLETPPARAGARLVAIGVALGVLHGAYDFPILLLDGRAPAPSFVLDAARGAGLTPVAALRAAILCVIVVIAGLAAFVPRPVLRARPDGRVHVDPAPVEGRWLRFGLRRGTGVAAALLLLAPSLGALGLASLAGYAADQSGAALMTAILVAFPVALALLILAYPPTPKTRAPATRARRWIQAVAAALAIACLGAAYRWGAEPAREILAAPAVFKGMANAAKGDHEAALRDFDRALALAPRWADPLAKRANSESALGRYDEALRDVDAAVLAWPRNADLLIQRAELHRHRHEPRAVVADLTGAVEIAPKSPVAWALRAEANTEAGDAVGARSDIARALALGPADLMALTVQAQMFLADGDFDSALRSIDSALGSHPDDPRALFLRGRILIYQREPEKAASDFARVSQSSKALYAPLWLFLAEARLGRDGSLPLWLALKAAGGQWPAPIAEQFLDHQTQARTREAAAADDQRCEADFYAGELYLAHDNDAPARELLQTAAAECPVDFIEREGAIAELRTLDADARVPRSAMPSAPAPTTPPPSAPRDESATATALASAGGHQFMVSAAWSFIDDGAEGGRLDVALALLDSPARGKLSLVKRVVSGEVSYEVLFSVPAGDRAAPPFSGLGKRLGIPLVHAPRRPAIFPSTSEFAAIDRDTYRLTLDSKKDVASALYLMAGGDQLSLLFNPDEGVRSGLTLELNSDTERVVRRAIDAWR